MRLTLRGFITSYIPLVSENEALSFCSVYNKTLEYVKTFAKFNTTDSASAVRECVSFHRVLINVLAGTPILFFCSSLLERFEGSLPLHSSKLLR